MLLCVYILNISHHPISIHIILFSIFLYIKNTQWKKKKINKIIRNNMSNNYIFIKYTKVSFIYQQSITTTIFFVYTINRKYPHVRWALKRKIILMLCSIFKAWHKKKKKKIMSDMTWNCVKWRPIYNTRLQST